MNGRKGKEKSADGEKDEKDEKDEDDAEGSEGGRFDFRVQGSNLWVACSFSVRYD